MSTAPRAPVDGTRPGAAGHGVAEWLRLGGAETLVPRVGVGAAGYHSGVEPLRRALELGMTLIDTAEAYGTEEIVGRAVRPLRGRAFVATKVSSAHLERGALLAAADGSLSRLGLDHIDLYQVHWPNARVPIEETMGAMEELVDAGKVRYIGVSNFSVRQLSEARAAMRRHPIVSNQVHYSLLNRQIEGGLLPYCRAHGITVIAYRPLGLGLARLLAHDPRRTLELVAARTGRTVAQVALNWCLAPEGVVVIPGANSIEHVEENAGATGWRLSAADYELLRRFVREERRRSALEVRVRRTVRRALGMAVG